MTKMYTRSSARQAKNHEVNLSTSENLLEDIKKSRRPRPDIYFSDDSDDGSRGLTMSKTLNSQHKSSRRKPRKSVKKVVCDETSGNETKSEEDDNLKNKTKKLVMRPVIISDDDFDDESEDLNRIIKISTPRKQKLRSTNYDMHGTNYVSPSKQRKITDGTPQTPKHNKIEQNAEVQTPSRLLVNLKLTSPAKSNTALNDPSSLSRKELFIEGKERSSIKNAKTETKITSNVYRIARKALHSTFPTDMPGREKELNELKQFINTCIETRTAGSLYVSGPPGTGKTACLNLILQEETIFSQIRKVYINCTAIKSPTAIYSKIAKEVNVEVSGKSEKDYLTAVENYLKKQNKMILLVLDEIDQLESKNQSILYTIFEWPAKPNSKLILVGIANALDLTDRKLLRLQGHCELKPKLMHFAPYTKQQILQIFTERLKSAGVLEIFHPAALQMLAGKFAAGSGDVRRALDVGRRAVELVDENKSEEVLKPVENLTGKPPHKLETKTKTVELKQVINVLNNVFGTSQSLVDESDNTFPLQQKIIVCSLVLMLKKARNKDITVGKLHEVYKRVCAKRNICHVDQAEFVGLCSLIETRGIIKIVGKKEPRLNKVNLEWDEEEVADALKDKQLMSMILQDDSCLGKM